MKTMQKLSLGLLLLVTANLSVAWENTAAALDLGIAEDNSAAALAKQAQNPIASMISLPLRVIDKRLADTAGLGITGFSSLKSRGEASMSIKSLNTDTCCAGAG